ncbi:hypothetical protein L9F63_017736, partial [Diploptera punctata]
PLESKMVREDSCRNMYVHGVVEKEVKTSEEALQLYLDGLVKKKAVADHFFTTSNSLHSVFTIRLVQSVVDDAGGIDASDKTALKVSQLCFTELATPQPFSPRIKTGGRIKDTDHITKTLSKLQSCFEITRKNMMLRNKILVPFHESKLTYLLKNYLEQGYIHTLICLNPAYTEVDSILVLTKFGNLTEVLPETELSERTNIKPAEQLNNAQQDQNTCRAAEDELSLSLNSIFPNVEVNSPRDERTIHNLIPFLQARKELSVAVRDAIKSKENSFISKLGQIENTNILQKQENQRLHQIHMNLKLRARDAKNGVLKNDAQIKNLCKRMNEANSEYEKLEKQLSEIKHKRKQADLDIRKLRREFDAKLLSEKKKTAEHHHLLLKEQEAKFKERGRKTTRPLEKVNRVLNNEIITTSDSSESDIQSVGNRQQTIQTTPKPSQSSVQKTIQTTPYPSQSSVQDQQKLTGTRAQRYDIWLEHRSGVIPADLGTVLQPKMKKSKKIAKLPDVESLSNVKASKYCLLTQQPDSSGEMATVIYKGDVVPTAGGGAQIIYKDVEKLKQVSPLAASSKASDMSVGGSQDSGQFKQISGVKPISSSTDSNDEQQQ